MANRQNTIDRIEIMCDLRRKGKSVPEIADHLGIQISAVYHCFGIAKRTHPHLYERKAHRASHIKGGLRRLILSWLDSAGYRRCGHCKTVQRKDEFSPRTQYCRACNRERANNSYRDNPNKRAYCKAYSKDQCKVPLYSVWASMVARCHCSTNKAYKDYGGRGIAVCQEWRDSFTAFTGHMGDRPSGSHSIDRIDNNRGYEPSNCRWATKTEQARNTRKNRMITSGGKTLTLSEWAEVTGLNGSTIRRRIKRGLTPEQALATPEQPKFVPISIDTVPFDSEEVSG